MVDLSEFYFGYLLVSAKLPREFRIHYILPSYKVKYALLPIAVPLLLEPRMGWLMIILLVWLQLVGFDWYMMVLNGTGILFIYWTMKRKNEKGHGNNNS